MWYFEKLSPWQVSSAPKHDEFFSSDNRSIAHSLVREMTQNSSDNPVDPNGGIEVRFRFASVDTDVLPAEYFHGLESHLNCTLAHAAPALRAAKMSVLTVEDFGTTGLTGAYDDPTDNGNFNSFWRRYGESQKTRSKGGRHGVGKSTAANASRIRTVFGLTRRSDDGKLLLYGQAALWPHVLPDEKERRDSYGLFSSAIHPAPPLPYEGRDALSFAKAFGLDRGERTGLSLVIPDPVPELTEDAVIEATVENCFHQIITGQLRVIVGNTALTAESVDDVVVRLPSLRPIAEATALSRESARKGAPALQSAQRRERLDEGEFELAQLADLRHRWAAGQTVSLRLWVPVQGKKRGEETMGEAWLYLRRAKSAETARETYVRGRIIVPERRLMQGKDVLGLMVVRDGALSQFLGDSEQPSHTRWIMSKLKGQYSAPEYAFRRARHALADFERLVVGSQEGEAIKDLLKPFFYRSADPQPREADDDKGRRSISIPPASPPVLEVRAIRGGFVAVRPAGASALPRVRVEIRYNVRRGKPKFKREDFDLDSTAMAIECEGPLAAISKDASTGTLVVQGVQTGFRMKVTGFDPNRDLYVHVQEEGEAAHGA